MKFKEVLQNKSLVDSLLKGCSFHGSFDNWKKRKQFIAKCITREGSFLDVGCGNGFLLRCLQEWSEFSIIPYGIDINEDFLSQVQDVFPSSQDNFANINSKDMYLVKEKGLPLAYDYIFFSNIWNNVGEDTKSIEVLRSLQSFVKPNGKLLVGFYHQDKNINSTHMNILKKLGFEFNKIVENPTGSNLVGIINL